MHRHRTSPYNARFVIHQVEGGKITAVTIQDLPTVDPVIRQMLRLIIMQGNVQNAILQVVGAVQASTTMGKTTVYPAIQVTLPVTIFRGNVLIAMIRAVDGIIHILIILD